MMDEAAVWRVYVMEYARSKDQPWVDLISGMYREGTMDLPFSFILAQRGDRNVLVDTGFMQEEHGSFLFREGGGIRIDEVKELPGYQPAFRRIILQENGFEWLIEGKHLLIPGDIVDGFIADSGMQISRQVFYMETLPPRPDPGKHLL